MQHCAAVGVGSCFKVLGVVPYADSAALMKHSVALINPSLFEGWSTVVEEANPLGKRVLLSDIAVHREQAPERGMFFAPTDAADLAEAIWQAAALRRREEELQWAKRASEKLPERRLAFANTYVDIVREVIPL